MTVTSSQAGGIFIGVLFLFLTLCLSVMMILFWVYSLDHKLDDAKSSSTKSSKSGKSGKSRPKSGLADVTKSDIKFEKEDKKKKTKVANKDKKDKEESESQKQSSDSDKKSDGKTQRKSTATAAVAPKSPKTTKLKIEEDDKKSKNSKTSNNKLSPRSPSPRKNNDSPANVSILTSDPDTSFVEKEKKSKITNLFKKEATTLHKKPSGSENDSVDLDKLTPEEQVKHESKKEKKRRESIIQDFKTINANRDKKTLEKYISLAENDAYDLTNNPDNKKDGSIQVKTSRRQSVAIVNELNSAKKILKELNSLDNHRKEAEKLNDDDFKNYVDQGLKNVDIQVAKAALTLMNMPKASLMDDKAIEGMLSAGGKQSLPSLIKKHNIQNTELNTSNDALAILRSNLNNHSGLFGTKKIQEITDNQTTIKLHNWVYHTANEVSRRRQSLIVNNWEKPKFEDLNQGPRLSKVEEENFKKSPNWVKAKVGNLKKSGNSDGGIKTDSSFSKSELGKDTDVAERTFVRDNEVKPMKQKQKIGPIGTSMAQSPTPETTFGDANELKKRQKKTKLKKISKNTKIESGEE